MVVEHSTTKMIAEPIMRNSMSIIGALALLLSSAGAVASAEPPQEATAGDIIVQYRDNAGLERVRELLQSKRAGHGKAVFSSQDVQGDIAKIKRIPGVISAEPDAHVQAAKPGGGKGKPSEPSPEPSPSPTTVSPPNDSLWSYQWGLMDGPGGINALGAWSGDVSARVAVIDTGSTAHEDMVWAPGYDMISSSATARDGDGRDSNPQDEGDWHLAGECGSANAANSSWHGTHVAGIVGAQTNNSKGIAGVAPGSTIVPIRALGKCGGSLNDVADAITWASGGSVADVPNISEPVDVINLSLSGASSCYSYLQAAVDGAVSRGSVVVVAAGNENQNASNYAPGNCNNVITVGATSKEGVKSSFSNYGAAVDVSAPGGEGSSDIGTFVVSAANSGSTTPSSGNYMGMVGTSQAAPHVAGVAALLKSTDKSMSPGDVEARIVSSAKVFASSPSVAMGSGILDAAASMPVAEPTFAVNSDNISLSRRAKSSSYDLLANDVLTGDLASVALTGNVPCSPEFCVSVDSAGVLTVVNNSRLRGSYVFGYTVVLADGQSASADVSLTVR